MKEEGVVVCVCSPTIWERKAGGSGVQDPSELQSEFEASLNNTLRLSQNKRRGLREMTQELKAIAALADDPGLVPSIHVVAQNHT